MVAGIPMERDARVTRGQALGRRQTRRPQHPFNLVTKPYQIQPCAIAPVLPGETLDHCLLQSQVWSDPLATGMKNIGWWCEYWGFYVRHSALSGWEANTGTGLGEKLIQMMTLNSSLAAFQNASGNAWSYCYPGAIDYVLECTKQCVGAFFRDEGEQWDVVLVDNVPLAQIYGAGRSDAFDKLTLAANYQDRSVAMPTDVGQLDDAIVQWMSLRDAGLVSMDYDDWMKTYGSSGAPIEAPDSPRFHRPELLFHDRDFTYPTNTVEPTTGVPVTAAGWRRAVESRKRFFFDQPGWIIVFNCVRPKVYLGNQQGSVAGAMQAQSDWLPAVLNNHHDIGHKQFTDPGVGGTGPLSNVMTANYYIDIRDLLNYGDQFVNYATPASGATGVPFVALPAATASRRYPANNAAVMAFFTDTTNGRFRQDGMLSFSIKTYNKEPPNQLLTLGHSTV